MFPNSAVFRPILAGRVAESSHRRNSRDRRHTTPMCVPLLPQWLAVGQVRDEIQLSPKTNRFDPSARLLIVADAPSLQPCMGCFMDYCGSNLFQSRCFLENKSLIEHASA